MRQTFWCSLQLFLALAVAVTASWSALSLQDRDEGLAEARQKRLVGASLRVTPPPQSSEDQVPLTQTTPLIKPATIQTLLISRHSLGDSQPNSVTAASAPAFFATRYRPMPTPSLGYRPTPTPGHQSCSLGRLIWPLDERDKPLFNGGTFLLPDEVSCNGTLVSVHACFFYYDGGTNNTEFRMSVGIFRHVGENYQRIGTEGWIRIDTTRDNSSETQNCMGLNLTDPLKVLEGDMLAVRVRERCRNGLCPLLPNLRTGSSVSVFVTPTNAATIPVSKLMSTESYTNVYLDVSASIDTEIGDQQPVFSPRSVADISIAAVSGITIAAVSFGVLVFLITATLIIFCVRLRSKKQKSTARNIRTTSGETYTEPFNAVDLSGGPPKDRLAGNESTTELRESNRHQFVNRAYSDCNEYSLNSRDPETNLQLSSENPSKQEEPESQNVVTPLSPITGAAYSYATNSLSLTSKISGHYEVDEDYGEPFWQPSSMEDELRMQLLELKVQEIPRQNIQIHEHLGSGQFGTVYRGVWRPATPRSSPGVEVAVKSMEGNLTEEERVKFLQEAAIMGQFRHPNIVGVIGVITTSDPLTIVCELMRKGDLQCYLLSQRHRSGSNLSPEMPAVLLSFSRQIAAGMCYLAGKSLVHRDLAARNILVSENDICKIADFGLSRDLQNEDYYVSHGGKIPVKWTAPEALNYRKYSTASDVWSYGVLLYEIWAMGTKPFQGYTNNEALQEVLIGYRLPPPPGCPKQVYELMMKCWHPDLDSRPQFYDLLLLLQRPDFQLLRWSAEDEVAYSEKARTLGGPVKDGHELYTELQRLHYKSDTI